MALNGMFMGTRDHPPGCKDVFSLEVFKYYLEAGKNLEAKQAITTRFREKHPDKILVVIVQEIYTRGKVQIREILSLLVGANSSKRQFFNQVANLMCPSKDLGEFKCWCLDFETLMSSYYDEYKDNDGILYLALSCIERLPEYSKEDETKYGSSRNFAKLIHDFEKIVLDLIVMVERIPNRCLPQEEGGYAEDKAKAKQKLLERFDDFNKKFAEIYDDDDDWVLID